MLILFALIGHVIIWQINGEYTRMFEWVGTVNAPLTVIYNLGLMVLFGLIVGLILNRFTEITAEKRKPRNLGERNGETRTEK